jgi:ferredoxin-NADP reductase
VAFRRELEQLARQRHAQLWFVVGRRADLGEDPLNAAVLSANVPGLAQHDVYVCGPAGMTDAVIRELLVAGVPRRNIHRESFEF